MEKTHQRALPRFAVTWRLLPELLLALAALPLLGWAAGLLLALLAYPYPHDGLEGTLLHEAALVRAGEPLYQPLELQRFVSAPYPPLHAYMLALVDRYGGPHLFWSGRLLSLVAALLTALLLVLLVWRVGRSWGAGLLAAACFLAAPPVVLWGTRVKPDMLALLFTALGLLLAVTATGLPSRRGRWLLAAAAAAFAAAFFTKQTAVMAPIAVGLALLVGDALAIRRGQGRGRVGWLPCRWPTLWYGGLLLLLLVVPWVLLDLWSSGQYSFHVWEMHRGEGWKRQIAAKFMTLLPPYWPLALLSLGLLPLAVRHEQALVPACYALCAPLTLLGTGAVGANHNHLLETILALCLAGGCTVGLLLHLRPVRPMLLLAASLLLLAQWREARNPPRWYGAELEPDGRPARFIEFIAQTPGEVLADDISLLYAAGKPIRYDDPAAQGPLAVSGHWDQRGLLDDIANKRFSAILIPVNVQKETEDHAYRWSPEMIAAVRDHYRLLYRDSINTYVPQNP